MTFVDSSCWIGLQFARDARHASARALWADVRGPLLTTNLVLGETWTFLRRRLGHAASVAFLDRIDRAHRLTVARIEAPVEAEAWRWLRRHDERPYSFVDASSFAIMRRRLCSRWRTG